MDTSMLSLACAWIANGFSVIPIHWKDKRPAFDALRLTAGEGAGWGEYKLRQATPQELFMWFGGPRRNLGIVTGYNGLVVIDFDAIEAYDLWQSWTKMAGGIAAEAVSSYTVLSARGAHVYLIVDEPVVSYAVGAIDVKARWGYVLAPPSVHPSGQRYRQDRRHGNTIKRVERLADVFPFRPIVNHGQGGHLGQDCADPWESASRAISDCGGQGVVERIKAKVRLEDLFRCRANRWPMIVRCPFHADTNPSCYLYEDNHFHCYGCGAHGDVIDAYARLHDLTNREAIAELSAQIT